MQGSVIDEVVPPGCPKCRAVSVVMGSGSLASMCYTCGWRGRTLVGRPVLVKSETVDVALADDAACVHHPEKKASAVCVGTGDFICSLCLVELKGQTYSLQYLEAGGRAIAGKAFDRHLPRPDRTVLYFILLYFIPYINVMWALGMPAWIILSHLRLAEAKRLRTSDPLYAAVVSPARIRTLHVVAWLPALLVLLIALIIVLAMNDISPFG